MDALERISAMLSDPSPHKRIAAAVVLAELQARDPRAVTALMEMAEEPSEALAVPAIEALGRIGSTKALPVLLSSLERPLVVRTAAAVAIGNLGAEALPAIRERLESASPEVRASLSQILPSVGGKLSVEMTLEGLRGQPFDAVNKVALSVRQEVKGAPEGERKGIRAQVERFIAKKSTQADEAALRGALKILGYLELPDTAELLLSFVSAKMPPLVRMEAVTALRFALREGATRKALRKLMELLTSPEALIARSARDTLTVIPIGAELIPELAELASAPEAELAVWAIARLGSLGGPLALESLGAIASHRHRARAEAAVKALGNLEGGATWLARALVDTDDDQAAELLSQALTPLARTLDKKTAAALQRAGSAVLARSVHLGRCKLEAVRELDPQAWARALRSGAETAAKRDPARAEALLTALCRSPHAAPEDRYRLARLQLEHSSKDAHPKARERDPALAELERLLDSGFPLAKTLIKDKKIPEADRYYLGFHFAESDSPDAQALGVALLESLTVGRSRIAKAAKNKLALLQA